MTTSASSKQDYLQAKNQYFQAIKAAKRDYWNAFLTNNDSKSIFKAMSYTKDKRIERIPPIQVSTTGASASTTSTSASI